MLKKKKIINSFFFQKIFISVSQVIFSKALQLMKTEKSMSDNS